MLQDSPPAEAELRREIWEDVAQEERDFTILVRRSGLRRRWSPVVQASRTPRVLSGL